MKLLKINLLDFSWQQYVAVYDHFWQQHEEKHLFPTVVEQHFDYHNDWPHVMVLLRSLKKKNYNK